MPTLHLYCLFHGFYIHYFSFSSSFSNTNYITVGTSGINRDTYADGLDDIDNTPFILNKNVAFVYVGTGDLDDGANDNQDRVSIVVFHP